MATKKWLIDAWDLVEWLDNIDKENYLRHLRGKKSKWLNTQGVRHMINKVPTVDAEEVVHGRWIPLYPTGSFSGHCSVCKTLGSTDWNYCPNCGAKMDGGGE